MKSQNNKTKKMGDSPILPRSASAGPVHARTILVAEDDETILSLITIALSEVGYGVDAVVNGSEAWEAMLRRDYDLLITDNDMPYLTGLELVARIQESGIEVPIVIVSGGFIPEPLESLAPSVHAIISKPFCMFQLLDVVHEACNPQEKSVTKPSMQVAKQLCND